MCSGTAVLVKTWLPRIYRTKAIYTVASFDNEHSRVQAAIARVQAYVATASANVHFSPTYRLCDAHDLDLSPLESPKDGYEIDAGKEAEALSAWFELYLLPRCTVDTFPEFKGKGKERFMCIASALIGIDPVLREALKIIADAENPSPPY